MTRLSSRLWLWYMPAAVGAVAALVFGIGFWLALSGSLGQPLGSPPPPARAAGPAAKRPGQSLLLVLGDSLARGTGDESGKGFAADVLELLRRRGPAQIANLAVNGTESADVRDLVRSPNVRTLAASADLILLSVGANDLSHSVPGAGAPTAGALEEMRLSRVRLAANLREILGALREANSRAPICVLGLYNPFGGDSAAARAGSSVILSWNSVLQETALSFPGVFLIPTFDLFQGHPERLAVDRFHPNRKGYDAIAARMAQLIPGS